MTKPRESQDDEDRPNADLSDPLSTWARSLALALGFLAGGVGGYAVFASGNQAGTAVLLLIAGVLVLLGLQGTPMRRLTSGDHTVELAQLRRRAVHEIERSQQEESPEVAVAVADAIATIDPSLASYADLVKAYERGVIGAVERAKMKLDSAHKRGRGSRGIDARVISPRGSVNLDIKYRVRGPIGLQDVLARMSRAESNGFDGGNLLITNAPLSEEVREYISSHPAEQLPLEIVTWNDERRRWSLDSCNSA
jgi:hypothetical protein